MDHALSSKGRVGVAQLPIVVCERGQFPHHQAHLSLFGVAVLDDLQHVGHHLARAALQPLQGVPTELQIREGVRVAFGFQHRRLVEPCLPRQSIDLFQVRIGERQAGLGV